VTDRVLAKQVRAFVRGHLTRVPAVVAVRIGRVTGLYGVRSQVDVDVVLENRPRALSIAGLVSAYLVELAAIAGAVVIRRRRRAPGTGPPLFPLVVLPAIVVFTVATTYGTNRFRAAGETSLVVLAAVAVDAALTWHAARDSVPAAAR